MNNSVSAATGYSPNYLCCGREVDLGADISKHGGDLMGRMAEALELAKEGMERARQQMAKRLRRLRKQGAILERLDWVMVESDGINQAGHVLLSAKNRPRYLGPFKVAEFERELENFKLPPSLPRVFPWFSIQKLKLYLKTGGKDMTKQEGVFQGTRWDARRARNQWEPAGTSTSSKRSCVIGSYQVRAKDESSWCSGRPTGSRRDLGAGAESH